MYPNCNLRLKVIRWLSAQVSLKTMPGLSLFLQMIPKYQGQSLGQRGKEKSSTQRRKSSPPCPPRPGTAWGTPPPRSSLPGPGAGGVGARPWDWEGTGPTNPAVPWPPPEDLVNPLARAHTLDPPSSCCPASSTSPGLSPSARLRVAPCPWRRADQSQPENRPGIRHLAWSL